MKSAKLKVLLIAGTGVEKTKVLKLFKRIGNNRVHPYVGVDLLTKDIEFRKGEIATLRIWNIGEQRFEFIRSTFYKGAAGAILVFDLTREETYIEVRNVLTEIRRFAGKTKPFILVGDNVHLLKKTDKTIIRKQAREFANTEGGIYIETSPTSIDIIEGALHKLTLNIISGNPEFLNLIKDKTVRKSAKLRVEHLEKSRSGRSLCYIDQDEMFKLGLNTGDIIEIRGKKKTTGIAVSSSTDRGKGIIRLDGLQRLNAGATIGEFVSIKLTKVYPAVEIVLTPTRPNIDLKRQADAIKSKLIDKPLVIGDIVDVYGTFVQREDTDNPMSDLMKMFQLGSRRRATLGTLRLIVENLKPSDKVVKITRDTIIKVNK